MTDQSPFQCTSCDRNVDRVFCLTGHKDQLCLDCLVNGFWKMKSEQEEWKERVRDATKGQCGFPDEVHCSCYPILKEAIEKLRTTTDSMALCIAELTVSTANEVRGQYGLDDLEEGDND